ncbi:MAG: DnaJ domain-containing protein [Leptolyngbyaceae cyanobacterium MAG.088]|nr:DnaJ domain-containing protein [Leptolyngbyaceae cyanobacterium MAG.088]
MACLNYYYGVLNLEPGSTQEDIKRAYRQLAQQWHPDKFSKQPEQLKEAREKFELIKEAYDNLIQLSSLDASSFSPKISVRPPSAEEHYSTGIAYLQAGKRKQAVESFTQAIRKRSGYLKAYQARAFTFEQLGLHGQARADFDKVAELKRAKTPEVNALNEADVAFQQGFTQLKMRKYGAAIESFTTVIGLNPNHIDAYRYRSQAYFRRGYDEQADADFKQMRDLEQQAGSKAPFFHRQSSRIWRCVHTLSRHTDVVSGVAIARDGKKLVTSSYDQTLRLWSLKTGGLLKTFSDHSKAIHCVAFSWDSKFIASGSADKTIKIWDVRTGALLRSFGNLIAGHTDTVTALAFSPNHQFLASASLDKTVRLWAVKSGKEIYALKEYAEPILALAMGWDGKTIAYGGKGSSISMRHTKTGKPIRSLPTDEQPNRAVAMSRQGFLLALASGADIVIWNRQYQKRLFKLKGHTEAISALAFSGDNQTLVSGSYDKTIKLWDITTGQLIDTLMGHQAAVCSVAYGLNGKIIASSSADNTAKIWQRG